MALVKEESADVILGADLYGSLLCGEILPSSAGAPVAQRTHLGRVVFGRLPDTTTRNDQEDVKSSCEMTKDELYCEEFFKQTVQRTSSGRYVVKYPFKDSIDRTTLVDSKADPTDLAALTPGHFLVGGPITAIPEPSLLDTKTSRLTRWRQLQQMQQDFWKRWSCEYLHELQVRSKWQQTKPNIKVGDLVLVKDERTPPTQWSLGRVLEVHAGEDNLVRVATIRTQSSILKRAISKLVLLPIDNNTADEYGGRPNISSHKLDEVGGMFRST